jgi:hypothetical protein
MSKLFSENVYVILWRRLSDGSAGVFVRLVMSLALALLLTGMALCGSYLAALVFPRAFGRGYSGGGGSFSAYPQDWVLTAAFGLMGLLFLGCMYWMWSRRVKWRLVWRAALGTAAVWIAAGLALAGVEEWFRGDDEIMFSGIFCLAFAATLLVWAPVVARLLVYGRPAFQEDGTTLDVTCPKCGYSLVGLYEAHCPECGERFTLDRLLAAQGFAKPDEAEPGLKHTAAARGAGDRDATSTLQSVPS